MAKAVAVKRIFVFNGITLQDPDPNMSVNRVQDFWSGTHPALVNAVVEGPVTTGGKQKYEFRIARGDKG